MTRMLAIAIFLVLTPPSASGQAARMQGAHEEGKIGHVEQELIDLEKRWSEAFLKKDIATLNTILAEDIVIIYGDGSRGTKAKDIASIGVDEQVESNELDEFQVRVYGDVAVVLSRLTAKGTRNGKKFNSQFRFVNVYERRAGRWQCVVTQNTHIGKVEL